MSFPFTLPYVRWADVAVLSERTPVIERQIYDHELVYVMNGSGHIQIENSIYPAVPGNLFFILPRSRHWFRATTADQVHLLGVHFDWAPQHDTLAFPVFAPATDPVDETKFRQPRQVPEWDLAKHPYLKLKENKHVRDSLEAIISEYSRYDKSSREAAGALLAAFLLQLGRVVQSLEEEDANTPVGAHAVRRVEKARVLLESQLDNPLSVEEVAAKVGWSADHLRRMCRLVYHTSPLELQFTARLQLARQLLRHKDVSIAEIGYRCGFEDPSHFARAFKGRTGLTPRQYLRMAKRM